MRWRNSGRLLGSAHDYEACAWVSRISSARILTAIELVNYGNRKEGSCFKVLKEMLLINLPLTIFHSSTISGWVGSKS